MEISRFHTLLKNKKFLQRVFTAQEIRYCQSKKNTAQHFAVRFAAKEAVWKALSGASGVAGIGHKEIGVEHLNSGQPVAVLSKRLKKFEAQLSLSLSHSRDCALAVCVWNGAHSS